MRLWLKAAAAIAFIALGTAVPAQDPPEEPPIPRPRPDNLGPPDAAGEENWESAFERVYQSACPALLDGRIIGDMLPPLSEGQCGLQSPISVRGLVVGGREIGLPAAPVTSCAVATTLADWAAEVDAFAQVLFDAGVESLVTGPGYHCRLRNNAETGFVSEHGLGNAIDIAAIRFEDGREVSVLDDWRTAPVQAPAKFLAFAHGAACSRFTTVLGPAANEDHADHFHFDLGCHGRSCTARICE